MWGRTRVRLVRLLAVLLASLAGSSAVAAAAVLVVTAGGATRQFTTGELLTRRDAATLAVPHDGAYGRAMGYRAVPLPALLSALPLDAANTIEARAIDGFVVQLPRALIEGTAVPWVAAEDPAHPWPPMPCKTVSAGPFYLVRQDPEPAGISSEQWVYVGRADRGVFLAEEGERQAERVRARHRLVVDLLLAVGVPAEAAEQDAEGIEHHVSEATLEAFCKFLARGKAGA